MLRWKILKASRAKSRKRPARAMNAVVDAESQEDADVHVGNMGTQVTANSCAVRDAGERVARVSDACHSRASPSRNSGPMGIFRNFMTKARKLQRSKSDLASRKFTAEDANS